MRARLMVRFCTPLACMCCGMGLLASLAMADGVAEIKGPKAKGSATPTKQSEPQTKEKAETTTVDKDGDSDEKTEDVTSLDTVTITGGATELARTTGSAHSVKRKVLEEQQYDDVHRVLKQVPGVYVRDEDGYGLRPNIGLRGANSDRSAKITLMEDGVLMAPAPYAAPAAYYFPMTTRLTGVEVFKGPASIQYGPNTIGGALNLITRPVPSRKEVGGVDLSIGGYGARKAHAFYGKGTPYFGFLVEGAQLGSQGFKELDNGGNTGFDKSEFMLKVRANNDFAASVHHRLELKLGYAAEKSNETYLGLSDEDFKATPFRRYAASQLGDMKWTRTQAKLSYGLAFGETFELRAVAYRHQFDRKWTKLNGFSESADLTIAEVLANPTSARNGLYYRLLNGQHRWTGADNEQLVIGTNAREYLSQGVGVSAEFNYDASWFGSSLKMGFRIHADEIRRDHDQANYDMILGTAVRASDIELVKQNTGTAVAVSGYILEEIRLGDHVRLSPGLRFESIETELKDRATGGKGMGNEALVFVPGVGAWLGLGDHWGLLAGVHQGFSPLAPGSAQDAEPEVSTNYELGTRFAYNRVKGEVIGFYNDYENLVGNCTQSSGCATNDLDTQFNAGRAEILGVEMVINGVVFKGRGLQTDLAFTYTWTQGEFQTDFSSDFSQWGQVNAGDQLPYVPQHQVGLKLSNEYKQVGVTASGTFVSEMRDVAGQGAVLEEQRIASHLVVDLAGFYRPNKEGRVYATVDNVFNSTYMVSRRPFGARPGKRFQVNLGYQHTF